MAEIFNWQPSIGDPTIGGWITVALYLLAGISCWKTKGGVFREDPNQQSDGSIWRAISVVFFFLGINKQLDLQSAMTELGRAAAYSGGWYEMRRTVQIYFIVGIVLACAAAVPAILFWARKSPSETWLALVGSTFVLGYVLIRAASFHHIDHFLSSRLFGFKWLWFFEMTGIGIVLLASEWRRASLVHRMARRVAR